MNTYSYVRVQSWGPSSRLISDEALREYCDKNYHQILPIIAEKVHQKKVQQEKLKAVKACLNFEKTSRHSESKKPSKRRSLKERLGHRHARSMSGSTEPRHGRSNSPRDKGPEKRIVLKRLEKGIFHRLGDMEKNVSTHSRDSRHKSYHSSRRDTESCYQSSRSRETKIASEKRRNKRESSQRTEALSEREGGARGHWKSKPKKQKSSVEDDLSQAWEAAKTERWAMPTWCHMFNSTLTGNARVWFDDLLHESIDSYDDLRKAFLENYLQQKKRIKDPVEIHNIKQRDGESTEEFVRIDEMMRVTTTFLRGEVAASNRERKSHFRYGNSKKPDKSKISRREASGTNKGRNESKTGKEDRTEGPMIIEAEMKGYCVHRMYINGGSSSEILYEHCFNRFRPKIKNQMIPATTPLVGLSGEIIWPRGQISLLVKIGDEEHSTSAWMNFMVVRSPSPYNEIIGRPEVRRIWVMPSTAHEMLKFPVTGGTVTLQSSRIIPLECIIISGPEEGRKELCGLLRRNLDIFAWKPANMTRVSRYVAEHRLNIREGCLPVRQKKRGQAPERNKVICEEVKKLVEADIMKEVHYHSWLSNPVMEVIRDTKETFKTLREINMKLNPKKCAFGMKESTFLGYKVDADGLRVFPDKVEAVLSLPSPRCSKDVQKLNEKLASLNRFLSKSTEKSLPFFKTLKRCTKKSVFQWTVEAETEFKQMKQWIAELPMLTVPKEKKELIMYLAVAKEAISAILMTERDGKQIPIYFVSRALQGPEVNYTPMEKLILALVTRRLLKWRFELEEHDIHYRPRTSVKGKILADFIVERSEDDTLDTSMEDREELPDPWILFTGGSSCIDEYEALIAGLRISGQIGVQNLQGNVDSKLVANQVNRVYVAKESSMTKYLEKVKNLSSTFKEFFIKQVPRGENKKADALSKTASTSFALLSKQVLVEELKEKINRRKGSTSGSRRKGAHLDDSSLRIPNERNPPRGKEEGKGYTSQAGRYAVKIITLYKKSFLGPWLLCVGPL
nr:reverse transcriptase domain-containing protein [Tanacetum cinerariifolium]